jgi:DNA-binding CsgD family transcriptional regulator
MLSSRQTGYRDTISDALDRMAETTDARWLHWASAAAAGIGAHDRGEHFRTRAESTARNSMAVTTLAAVLEQVAWSDMMSDQVSLAAVHAEEGLALALETGMVNPACFHRSVLAWVAAARGEPERCLMLASQAAEVAVHHRLAPHHAIAGWALGLLYVGQGKWEKASLRLEGVATGLPEPGHPYVAVRSLPDLVEASLHADRPELAAWAVDRYVAHVGPDGSDWERALAARCRALLTDAPAEREALLWEALAHHDRDHRFLSRARTLLLLGEHLRRERRRKEARIPLQSALDAFEQAGARPWAERAMRELRASGQTVRGRSDGSTTELTFQERQIARIVAAGATNREAADQLFLSPRTVEYHLRSVFAKLGVASRAELVKVQLEHGSARLSN